MKNLKELREKRKLTQQDVAIHIGIGRPTYTRYEIGEREPDNATLTKLADFFNVSTDYLLGRKISVENYIVLDKIDYELFKETEDLTDSQKRELIDFAKFIKSKDKK